MKKIYTVSVHFLTAVNHARHAWWRILKYALVAQPVVILTIMVIVFLVLIAANNAKVNQTWNALNVLSDSGFPMNYPQIWVIACLFAIEAAEHVQVTILNIASFALEWNFHIRVNVSISVPLAFTVIYIQ